MNNRHYKEVEYFTSELYGTNKFLTRRGYFTQTIYLLQYATNAAAINENKRNQCNYIANIGALYNQLDNPSQAIRYYYSAQNIVKELGDKKIEASFIGKLGVSFSKLGNYDLAIKYYNQALQIAENIQDKHIKVQSLDNLGSIYQKLGEYSKAIEYYQQTLEGTDIIDTHIKGTWITNWVSDSHKLDNVKFIKLYQHSFKFNASGDKLHESDTLYNLGVIYMRLKNYKQAILMFKISLAIRYQMQNVDVIEPTKRILEIAQRKLSEQEKDDNKD